MDHSNMDSNSTTATDAGTSKATKFKWQGHQDKALVDALVELYNEGTHKADTGFKAGFLTVLESKLAISLCGMGIKGDPHIKSRLKTMKKDLWIAKKIRKNSRFGWDDTKKCVSVEKQEWADYCKTFPEAKPWNGKAFPFFDELSMIYGQDRATGADAQSPADVLEEYDRDHSFGDLQDDAATKANGGSTQRTTTATGGESSGRRRKKKTLAETIAMSMMDAATQLGSDIRAAASDMGRSVGGAILEYRSKLNDELCKIEGFGLEDQLTALERIGRDPSTCQIFFTMTDEQKEAFVRRVLARRC